MNIESKKSKIEHFKNPVVGFAFSMIFIVSNGHGADNKLNSFITKRSCSPDLQTEKVETTFTENVNTPSGCYRICKSKEGKTGIYSFDGRQWQEVADWEKEEVLNYWLAKKKEEERKKTNEPISMGGDFPKKNNNNNNESTSKCFNAIYKLKLNKIS